MPSGELETLREIEQAVRGFLKYFDRNVRMAERRGSKFHPFAPRTVETVERIRPALEKIDELRAPRKRGGAK